MGMAKPPTKAPFFYLVGVSCLCSIKIEPIIREVSHRFIGSASKASGSFMTVMCSCRTVISVSCLHLGQNSGKLIRIVSSRIFVCVLFPQAGHSIHLPFIRRITIEKVSAQRWFPLPLGRWFVIFVLLQYKSHIWIQNLSSQFWKNFEMLSVAPASPTSDVFRS